MDAHTVIFFFVHERFSYKSCSEKKDSRILQGKVDKFEKFHILRCGDAAASPERSDGDTT